MNDIVTKSAFASLCGVSNARVSQWLADGKLDGEAIVGHGHRARIRVGVARAQLKRRLNITQRLATGRATLDGIAQAKSETPLNLNVDEAQPIEEDIKAERLAQLRHFNKIPWGVDSGRLWEQTEVVNPLNPWRRPMSLDHRCEEPTAIRSNVGAIFVSLELSRSTWLITSLSPGSGEKMSKYGILAGDLAALLAQFSGLKQKAFARTGKSFSIVVIQEAGLDGFSIHRVLQSEGIESYVVDPASIATSRRRRRAKTDRIDGEALVRALLAYKRGEPRVCAIVSAPTPEDEDNRRLCRERKALTAERIQHVNRIKGLLFSQGVSDYEPLRRNRRQRLDELKTGDSRPLPMHLKAQIGRELDRLELLLEQIKAVEAERDALLASAKPTEETSALPAMLVGLKGIGPEFAAVLWSEGLYQIFANRKQVAAYAGLAPTPWQSGTVAHEQGVSKAGNPRLRTTMIQLAWLWLRHQPHSALAQWFKERVKRNGGRLRKTTIVALARKLLVALWKYVNAGVVIEGAVMKVSS